MVNIMDYHYLSSKYVLSSYFCWDFLDNVLGICAFGTIFCFQWNSLVGNSFNFFMHFVCVCVSCRLSFLFLYDFFLMWILCCKQVRCMGHMRLLGLRYLSDLISNLQPWDCVAFTYDYSSSSLLLSVKIKFHALFSFHFWYDLSKILGEGYRVNVSSFLVSEQLT